LPEGLIPVAAARPLLQQAVKEFTAAHGAARDLNYWKSALLFLWRQLLIELHGRLGFPGQPLLVIDCAVAERVWHPDLAFDLANARLLHRPSGRIYYDVHLRVCEWIPAAADMGQEIPLAPEAPQAVTPRRPGKVDQALPLLKKAWEGAGRPQHWSRSELFTAAEAVYPKDRRLKMSDKLERAAWRKVLHPADDK